MGQTDDQGRFTLQAETRARAVVEEHAVILEDMALYPRAQRDGTVLGVRRSVSARVRRAAANSWHVRVAPEHAAGGT